jgi:hypothetical protein
MSKSCRRKNKIAGQFSARTIEMMESPAFCTLSYSARRVLDRIEIEHAHHGGHDNGQLPVTYNQFHDYGIHRHAISPALREAGALGFIEITEHGRAGNAECRRPNKFRLTYRYTGRAKPTDEWRKIKTLEEAEMVAQAARRGSKPKHLPVMVSANFSGGNRHRKHDFHSAETVTTGLGAETVTTSIFWGGGGGCGGCLSSEGCDEVAAVIARELDKLS